MDGVRKGYKDHCSSPTLRPFPTACCCPEFPRIRIDYFRHHPPPCEPPLACFLSHVHSDHLTGLEALRSPFVYCSAATREILLRLEKYHYRANFARGILESRNVTYDRTMQRLAGPLPLDTPTVIELAPNNNIKVTLFEANHCIGAVMFLIEGHGNAVLYTGDIRAEAWWVNSLVQNPVLVPYTLGASRLDCVYLDTTSKSNPEDTIFYFYSWTFGYESVWIALSLFLQSLIHLDDYRYRLYESLSSHNNKSLGKSHLGFDIREAPILCGFQNGNYFQPGCLTHKVSGIRIHSYVVHIIPIVTRANRTDIAELGAGGGKGDLDQKEELETGDVADLGKLMELCARDINDDQINLNADMYGHSQDSDDSLSLKELVSLLTIRFPYSRHSSYSELCLLVDAFKPKDVYPCTVDEEEWTPSVSMRHLFGEFCSLDVFRHDSEMSEMYECRISREQEGKRGYNESQVETQESGAGVDLESPENRKRLRVAWESQTENELNSSAFITPVETPPRYRMEKVEITAILTSPAPARSQHLTTPKSVYNLPCASRNNTKEMTASEDTPQPPSSNAVSVPPLSTILPSSNPYQTPKSQSRLSNRDIAYKAALGFSLTWAEYRGLVSTRRSREEDEEEL
ncbi:hypothetical protein CC78DRAFT_619695 [Lojkania enalia]|uniref:Protein artemis n=1 Tax=Lojkania enalia TaxID=147567 RepID=A0A9P4K548_9PLEO|nr:hypothetical protein CC78DRAFT_619695 [Didymosphaeria enalia]